MVVRSYLKNFKSLDVIVLTVCLYVDYELVNEIVR